MVIDSFGCLQSFTDTISIIGSSIQTITDEGIFIYPNPAHEQLVVGSRQLALSSVRILDIIGMTCSFQSSIINHQLSIDISSLISGVYFIELKAADKTITRKFVKQ